MRYSVFREAVRKDAIDPRQARSIFRKSYMKLADICEREGCSMNRARTINAFLEAAVDAALRRAKLPGILKTYDCAFSPVESKETMTPITPDLISVKPLDGYKLDLVFADGKRGVFDCSPYMNFEFMEDVREPHKFAAVRADHGTAAWPGGEDLCPDDLYTNMISVR